MGKLEFCQRGVLGLPCKSIANVYHVFFFPTMVTTTRFNQTKQKMWHKEWPIWAIGWAKEAADRLANRTDWNETGKQFHGAYLKD